jgi:hypothetical protein
MVLPIAQQWATEHGLAPVGPVMSMTSLKWEAGFHPQGNRRHGQNGWSILHCWCGCDRSERSPHAMPFGRGKAKAPLHA